MMRYTAVLLLSLLLGACAAPPAPLPPTPEAEILLGKLVSGSQRWQQLDTAAEVGFTRNGRFLSTQQFMLLEKPDRLRVDVLSLFGQLAMQLTVAEGELQVFLNTSVPGQYYQGPANDEVLSRFTRLPLRAEELVRLLLYDPPYPADQPMWVETTADRYLLHLGAGERQQQFYFDGQLRLRSCLYLSGEEILLRVAYDKLEREDGFPRRVEVELPQQQTRVSLQFSEVKLNQTAKAGRFDLTFPANAVPLQLPEFEPGKERS